MQPEVAFDPHPPQVNTVYFALPIHSMFQFLSKQE
jgi:hypothetical protein